MAKLPVSESFTHQHLLEWFGEDILAQAEAYLDAIDNLDVKAQRIVAEVQGKGIAPYLVLIHFLGDKPEEGMISGCTCSVQHHCRHGAATLLYALKQRTNPDRVSPGVLSWITDLRQLTQAVEKTRGKHSSTHKSRVFYLLDWRTGQTRIRLLRGTRPEIAKSWMLNERVFVQPPPFVEDDDLPILRLLWAERDYYFQQDGLPISLKKGADLFQRLLASGRLIADSPPITLTEGP
ncbi:MAG: SWIM zinc finger family protein, partial [Azovibrio sp.]